MISAFLEGNQYGFEVIDDSYLDIVKNKLVGTLGIGSRRSSFFIRIYTLHKLFVRWETELKQNKAQKLFDELAKIGNSKLSKGLLAKRIRKSLLDAAIDQIEFRNKSIISSPKNATRKRTSMLPFWSRLKNTLDSSINNQADSNYLEASPSQYQS